jgi:hypothetical protein
VQGSIFLPKRFAFYFVPSYAYKLQKDELIGVGG